MRWRKFNEWKTYTITFLLHLPPLGSEGELAKTALIEGLRMLKLRDLGHFLLKLHQFSVKFNVPLKDVMPTPEEVDEFFEVRECSER